MKRKILSALCALAASIGGTAAAQTATPLGRAKAACRNEALPVLTDVGSFKVHAVWFVPGNAEVVATRPTADRIFLCLEVKPDAPTHISVSSMALYSLGWISHHGAFPATTLKPLGTSGTLANRYVVEAYLEWLWTRHFKSGTWKCPKQVVATGIRCGPRPAYKGDIHNDSFVTFRLSGKKADNTSLQGGWVERAQVQRLP